MYESMKDACIEIRYETGKLLQKVCLVWTTELGKSKI